MGNGDDRDKNGLNDAWPVSPESERDSLADTGAARPDGSLSDLVGGGPVFDLQLAPPTATADGTPGLDDDVAPFEPELPPTAAGFAGAPAWASAETGNAAVIDDHVPRDVGRDVGNATQLGTALDVEPAYAAGPEPLSGSWSTLDAALDVGEPTPITPVTPVRSNMPAVPSSDFSDVLDDSAESAAVDLALRPATEPVVVVTSPPIPAAAFRDSEDTGPPRQVLGSDSGAGSAVDSDSGAGSAVDSDRGSFSRDGSESGSGSESDSGAFTRSESGSGSGSGSRSESGSFSQSSSRSSSGAHARTDESFNTDSSELDAAPAGVGSPAQTLSDGDVTGTAPAVRAELPGSGIWDAAEPSSAGLEESGEMTYFRSAAEMQDRPSGRVALDSSEPRRSVATPFGVDQVSVMITVPEVEGGLPEGEFHWANQFDLFRQEALKLGRSKRWRRLAAVTAHAIVNAPYSQGGTRTAMLLDLARIYRDRLKDMSLAEEAFLAAAREEPENAEAIAFLYGRFEERGDYRAMYELFFQAVSSTWDPDDRLEWTRRAAEIAHTRLRDVDAGTRAWEQLWGLADAEEEVALELTRYYRIGERWPALVAFLDEAAKNYEGATQRVLLRELAEVHLSGNNDPAGAADVLQRITADQPNDPLVIHQLARIYTSSRAWADLEALGTDVPEGVSEADTMARRHLSASALWDAGRWEQAARVYALVLAAEPDDATARERYHAHLEESGQHEALIGSLLGRVDAIEGDAARADLLLRASTIAEDALGDTARAISLLEQRHEIVAPDASSLQRLAALYEAQGDDSGLLRSLDGLRSLAVFPEQRLEILRRLARHSMDRADDEATAEACWKEILSIDANDMAAREELMALHQRRGDFEALNSALLRQIVLTDDDEDALRLSRMAAQNLDTNFEDAQRSIEGWRRVLDYAPADGAALAALSRLYAQLGDRKRQISVLEERIQVLDSPAERSTLALEVAALWTESDAPFAAAAAYERVLHWEPANRVALDGLLSVYSAHDRDDLALAALDQALGGTDSTDEKVALLRRSLSLVSADALADRFARLRRIHLLNREDTSVVAELRETAEAGGLWESYAAVLESLISELPPGEARSARIDELGTVLSERLNSPDRAYLLLQSQLWGPETESALEPLTSLAGRTGRYEDVLALLGTRTRASIDSKTRVSTIKARAAMLELQLETPVRAFAELRRLLEIAPSDWAPLESMERLAESHELWPSLVDVLMEVGDRCPEESRRAELHARIEAIARTQLDDVPLAFARVTSRFRLTRDNATLREQLERDAEAHGLWSWVLPVLEAACLADLSEATADDLAEVARLYAEKADDKVRAFDLYTLAFAAAPESESLPDRLAALVDEVGAHEELAQSLRRAAAMCDTVERAVDLLRRTAALYEGHLDRPADFVDVHRRLLELQDDELASLEVMIGSHRERSQWHDLRDRLTRWVEVSEPSALRQLRLMEIGRISEEELDDVHRALDAYGQVLAEDPEQSDAHARVEAIVKDLDDPRLRLEFLEMELARANDVDKSELELSLARLRLERMDDTEGAIGTLRSLVDREGVMSPGFEPLAELYRSSGAQAERVALLMERADAESDAEAKRATLRSALEESLRFEGESSEMRERVFRALLEVDESDVTLHRQLAQLLRGEQRYEELAALLGETAELVADPVERYEVRMERARLLHHNLKLTDDAFVVWTTVLEEQPEDEAAMLSQAFARYQAGDVADYVARRTVLARTLDPEEGALVLCHLAEVCDEAGEMSNEVADLYREARRMDSGCEPAKAALKGIGRRKKELRPEAALLPVEGERDMSWSERGAALRALGDEALATDLQAAIGWYRRAIATDVNEVVSWDALAAAYDRTNLADAAYRARVQALQALRRSTPLSPEGGDAEAERLLAIAGAAPNSGSQSEYERIIRRVHSIAPTHAGTALAVAELMIERGEVADAAALLDALVSRHTAKIPASILSDVYFARGRAHELLGSADEAMDNYRAALRERVLFAPALRAYAGLLGESGQTTSAIEHLIRALVTESAPEARATLFFDLGVLWEDGVREPGEAGACFELARASGLATRELMLRVFKHFQRTGQLQQGLDVVDTLLESASEPSELASLWLARGEIYSTHEGREEEAVEAFDMALSYDPDLNAARSALAVVLERRGDWDQLLQILEAIAESEAGEPAERASAFLHMARIATGQLDDLERAEEFLRASIDADPSLEALQLLAEVIAETSGGGDEHRELIGQLVALGPPWYEHATALGRAALEDEPSYAWSLLAPALMIRSSDDELKARLRDMRRDHERPPILVLPMEHDARAWPAEFEALQSVLERLDEVVSLGVSELEALDVDGVTDVSVHSNIGRTFASFVVRSGLEGCSLHRSNNIVEPVRLVNREEGPAVVIRADVFQQLARAEIGFMLAYASELARPGNRGMAATPPAERIHLLEGLLSAVEVCEPSSPAAEAVANVIRGACDAATLERWGESLIGLADEDVDTLAERYWTTVVHRALRMGLVAGADLFQAVRLVARMQPVELERPGVFEDDSGFDAYLSQSTDLIELVRFAASPEFARQLGEASEV